MFCTKCGTVIKNGDLFCGKCGTKLTMAELDKENLEVETPVQKKDPVWVRQANINPMFSYLCVGDVGKVEATVFPKDADDVERMIWESSDNEVAEVTNAGYVRAKKAGAVTITLKGEIFKTQIDVLVKEKAIDMTLSHRNITIKRGRSQRILCNAIPEGSGVGDVEWVLDNPNIGSLSVASDKSYCDFEAAMGAIGTGNIHCTSKITSKTIICPVKVTLQNELDNALGVLIILFGISLLFASLVDSFSAYFQTIFMPISLLSSLGLAIYNKGKKMGYNVLALLNLLLILFIFCF